MVRLFLLLGIFLFNALFLFAQQKEVLISGNVVDEANKPIEFTSVYINGTTLGTQTDAQGAFQLKVPYNITIEIVASLVGYQSTKKKLILTENKILTLTLVPTILDEVTISAKRTKEWKKKWKLFKDSLLGKVWPADLCEIKNPDAIIFVGDEKEQSIFRAKEPIIIENHALGYRITLDLQELRTDGKSVYLIAEKFFEEMKPESADFLKKWNKNRFKAYHYSFKNFLEYLAHNEIQNEEFEVYKMLAHRTKYNNKTSIASEVANNQLVKINKSQYVSYNSAQNRYSIGSNKPLLILIRSAYNLTSPFTDAPCQISQIVLPKLTCSFTENGWITEPNGITLLGFWGNEGIANLLPMNYSSSKSETFKEIEISVIDNKLPISKIDAAIPKEQEIVFVAEKITVREEHSNNMVYFNPTHTYALKEKDFPLPLEEVIRRLPGVYSRPIPIEQQVINNEGLIHQYFLVAHSVPISFWIDGKFYGILEGLRFIRDLNARNVEKIELVKGVDAAMFGADANGGMIAIYTKNK